MGTTKKKLPPSKSRPGRRPGRPAKVTSRRRATATRVLNEPEAPLPPLYTPSKPARGTQLDAATLRWCAGELERMASTQDAVSAFLEATRDGMDDAQVIEHVVAQVAHKRETVEQHGLRLVARTWRERADKGLKRAARDAAIGAPPSQQQLEQHRETHRETEVADA